LEKTEQAVVQEPVEDFTAVFIKNSDGTEIPLEALKTDGADSAYRIDTKEFPNAQSIVVKNNNTHKKIILTTPETINTSAAGDFIPLHPADIASDAKIKYQGITVTRPTNSMDDVVPNVTYVILDREGQMGGVRGEELGRRLTRRRPYGLPKAASYTRERQRGKNHLKPRPSYRCREGILSKQVLDSPKLDVSL